MKDTGIRSDFTLLTADDLHLFNEGTHYRLYDKLGAHRVGKGKEEGICFSVWAPDAREVAVIGDFNGWSPSRHPLRPRDSSGVWEGVIRGVPRGSRYKYRIVPHRGDATIEKADPFAVLHEAPPATASVVWDLEYAWNDREWMASRAKRNRLDAPMSLYEVHLGSWRRVPEEKDRWMTYRELADPLTTYVRRMGFTHVELLPIMEHPFTGSWGYQTTGYFAPTARYGTPQDFMYLVDRLHQAGIGVILDWVPSHFPGDAHGLAAFDGTHLYEHADPRKGFHPDWKSYIFNYGRHEVRSFLLSSAMYWLEKYHADGLRVDAVASMLYLDYSRKDGEWIPNEHGGRENLEAIGLLRQLNEVAYGTHPDVQIMAEESTSWPMVSRPTYVGGLGFGLKWDMGWMHDTLAYLSRDPVHRKYHHDQITFRLMYAFTENFLLPLSHDEVVHGKGSLIRKMPGDAWQKAANLRLLLGYMFGQPGKKLLFMGGEFGQEREWNHDVSLDWHLTELPLHRGLQQWVADLNGVYRGETSLFECDAEPGGFEWIECHDADQCVLSFLRRGRTPGEAVCVVCNFTPIPRYHYRVGVPGGGTWREILNSDAREYGGSGMGNGGGLEAEEISFHGRPYSLDLTVPPLSAVFLRSATCR